LRKVPSPKYDTKKNPTKLLDFIEAENNKGSPESESNIVNTLMNDSPVSGQNMNFLTAEKFENLTEEIQRIKDSNESTRDEISTMRDSINDLS